VAVAVAHAEQRRVAALLDRAVHDLAGELVGASGIGAGQQSGGLNRRAGRGEARVDQGTGEQERGREGHDEADAALARGIHALLAVY
jgi:hypothetical protein